MDNGHVEINLREVRNLLRSRRLFTAALTLSFAVAGVVISSILIPPWQASAVVQIGSVGNTYLESDQNIKTRLVELPARTAERVRMEAFKQDVIRAVGATGRDALVIRYSLKARPLPDTDLIEFAVDGRTEDGARKSVEAIIKLLRQAHDVLAAPRIARLEKDLSQIIQQIQDLKTEQKRILEATRISPSDGFGQSVLFGDVVTTANIEIGKLTRARLLYEEELGPSKTYSTSTINTIFAEEQFTWTTILLVAGLSALAGLITAVFLILWSRVRLD